MRHPPNPEELNHKPTYHVPTDPYAEIGIASFGWTVRIPMLMSVMITAATPLLGLLMLLNILFDFKRTVIFLITNPAYTALWFTLLSLCTISILSTINYIRSIRRPIYFEKCDYLAQIWFIAFGSNGLVLIYIALSAYS